MNRWIRLSLATAGVALLLGTLAPAALAGPHGRPGSTRKHDRASNLPSGTAYDEDTDGNDGTANNVADDGDNAHPSGKDRSVEHGGSNNQGRARSNPDDSKGPMRHEGAPGPDEPNGPGGTDLADQDGNNGCGNDDDFDDDNNGHCGRPSASSGDDDRVDGAIGEEIGDDEIDDEVAGLIRRSARPADRVLGLTIRSPARRAAAPPGLPSTGTSGIELTLLVALGLGIVALGSALRLPPARSDERRKGGRSAAAD